MVILVRELMAVFLSLDILIGCNVVTCHLDRHGRGQIVPAFISMLTSFRPVPQPEIFQMPCCQIGRWNLAMAGVQMLHRTPPRNTGDG